MGKLNKTICVAEKGHVFKRLKNPTELGREFKGRTLD